MFVEMDIEPASETECRDRGLGGTLEDNREECFLETPMMSAANQTGDSSCPLWLRKVCCRDVVEHNTFSLNHMKCVKVSLHGACCPTGTGGCRVHPDARGL